MNTQHDIKLEEIYIPSKHNKDTYLCEDFIIYPDGKEKHGGFVFGIIEIRATATDESEKIIKVIVNTLKDKYYNQINSSPDPSKLNLETVFEYALQKTNEALTELIQISHINFPIENLNYMIAVAKPTHNKKDIDLYFTQQGLINVYLLHKTKQNNYKLINIIDNTPKTQDTKEELKFFSSTLTGKIYYHDAIITSTEIFNNYIPPHKINKILASNDLPTAINYFKTLINNVKNNSYLTYASIFVKMEETKEINEMPVSQKSMNNLISTKEKTEKFLTPTFALNIRDTLFGLLKNITGLLYRKKENNLKGPKTDKKMKFGIAKYVFNAIRICGETCINLIKKPAALFSKTDKEPKNKEPKKPFQFNQINKSIIIAVVALIILLVSSIFWIQHRKQLNAEKEAYAQKMEIIQNQINDAQVNLIYQNNSESLNLIRQAEEEVKYLPQATDNQKANYEELLTQINNIKNKLLNIEKIVPKLITEVSINSEPTVLDGLTMKDNEYLVFGKNNALFSVSDNNVSSPMYSDKGDFRKAVYDEKTIFLTSQNNILEYKDNSLTELSSTWQTDSTITSLDLYGSRLYTLDANNQQIYKYSGNDSGFGSAQTWITDKGNSDLSQAIDLTIDGNIYVINTAGQITKFFSGALEEFNQGAIEPELTNAKKIYTTTDLNNLYILEDKRIVVLSKEGNFINQYLFESLSAPIFDFIVTGQDEKIILVSANKVYEASIK